MLVPTKGFKEAAEGLWERLEPNLMGGSIGGRKKKIIFTGHSLGAGTCELTALHAAASSMGGAEPSQITTFGGPCIGDASFAAHVNYGALANTDITHVVHDYDPILYNNGPLWERLGFERSGSTLRCDPHEARILTQNDNDSNGPRIPPFNIIDHCKYLGVFVGPRFKL